MVPTNLDKNAGHNCASTYRRLDISKGSAFGAEPTVSSLERSRAHAGLPSSRCGLSSPPTSTAPGTDGRPVCGRICANATYAKKLGPDLVAVELFGAALEFSQIADR